MTMSGGTWQEQAARRTAVSREARTLPREPASWPSRVALGLATVAWLGTLVWLVATLPERVPTHWSSGTVPDRWSSRGVALAMSALLPPAIADVQIGVAAHRPGGEVPGWAFPVTLACFLASIGLVVARMGLGGRYRPREDDPDLG